MSGNAEDLYIYKAYITDVYDGRTISCIIDCGFNIGTHQNQIQLYGIQTPNIACDTTDIGIYVRDELRKKILDKKVYLKIIKNTNTNIHLKNKYLGLIYTIDSLCINEWLVDMNYAINI